MKALAQDLLSLIVLTKCDFFLAKNVRSFFRKKMTAFLQIVGLQIKHYVGYQSLLWKNWGQLFKASLA